MFGIHSSGIDSAEELRKAADELRKFDKKLPSELRFLLRRTAQPLIRQQKRALMAMPGDYGKVGPGGIKDMRRTIARGIKLRLRTGAGRHGAGPIYRIESRMPSKDAAMVPRGLDTEFEGWMSPYFGEYPEVHHEPYKGTGTGPSWFLGPAKDEKVQLREEIVMLLKLSAQEIADEAKHARGVPGFKYV